MSAGDARVPEVVVGRYAVFDVIGAGGMARVHLGRLMGQGGFARTVAIKRLHPEVANSAELSAMLLDEARLAARIRHSNVVPTLDVVAAEGELLLVMEYVHGESLARLLAAAVTAGQRVPLDVASAVVSGVLMGLHAAHEAMTESGAPLNLVHRDVSPHNVLVGVDGVPRILDFGIAKASTRVRATQPGTVRGKLAYMAPEQLQQQRVDRRADVFAAAAVLWELVAGRRLFASEDPRETMREVLEAPSPLLTALRPEASGALAEVARRGLEKTADARYATALEMARALGSAVSPASSAVVADWVRGLAQTGLDERAAKVTRVEQTPLETTVALPATLDVRVREQEALLQRSQESTQQQRAPEVAVEPPRRRVWPVVVAVSLAMTLGAVVIWSQKPAPRVAPVAATVVAPEGEAAPEPASEPAPPTTATPSERPHIRAPIPKVPRPRAQTGPPAPACDPPYYWDKERDIKVFKSECFK